MPPLTSSLLSWSSAAGPRVTAAAAAAISKPAAITSASAATDAGPSPSAPAAHSRQQRASPFASGLAGCFFGGHRTAARSSSSAAAVFERRFAFAVEKILDWENNSTKQVETPFKPARVLLQDFTGAPEVVDLACMRDAMSKPVSRMHVKKEENEQD